MTMPERKFVLALTEKIETASEKGHHDVSIRVSPLVMGSRMSPRTRKEYTLLR